MWMLFVARYGMNGLEASSTWDVYAVGGRVASVEVDYVISFAGN